LTGASAKINYLKVNRLLLAFFFCFPFLGCELQQNPKPYEFDGIEQEADKSLPPAQKNSTPITRSRVQSINATDKQDPNKSFHDVRGKVVKGSPRHDFPDLTFPE
jgi:hypothetical protein